MQHYYNKILPIFKKIYLINFYIKDKFIAALLIFFPRSKKLKPA